MRKGVFAWPIPNLSIRSWDFWIHCLFIFLLDHIVSIKTIVQYYHYKIFSTDQHTPFLWFPQHTRVLNHLTISARQEVGGQKKAEDP